MRPFPAYKGDEPYVFVSYAHEDASLVYKELEWLKAQGFNVWYDEGISPGASWRDELAESILNCNLFILFVSERSINSENCLKEVNFALEHQRSALAVHMEHVSMPPGLELSLSDRQAILKYELNEQDYHTKLVSGVGTFLGAVPAVAPFEQPGNNSKLIVTGFGLGIFTIMVIALLIYNKPSSETLEIAELPVTAIVPRVAVLPFENRSDDPGERYFSDGLSEDIATALSRFSVLSVIPPSIASKYRGKDDTVAADELRARYLVRGSVRRSPDEVRVSVSLLDPRSGTQLWAETYPRKLVASSLFDMQAEIAASVAATLADATGIVVNVGLQDIRRHPTDSLEAYDCVLRGHAYVAIHTDETHKEARDCLEHAVEIDPNYADAWAHLAYLYQEEYHHSRNVRPRPLGRALEAARRAVELDATNPMGLLALAMTHFSRREVNLALNQMHRALALNPNDTTLISAFATVSVYAGDIEKGLELVDRARDLNPTPPNWIYLALGGAHYLHGEYEQALLELGNFGPSHDAQIEIMKAASLGMLGRREEARRVLDELLAVDVAFAEDPPGILRRYFLASETLNAVADGLAETGLQNWGQGKVPE